MRKNPLYCIIVVLVWSGLLLSGCVNPQISSKTSTIENTPKESTPLETSSPVPSTSPPTSEVTATQLRDISSRTEPYARAIILFIGDGMGEVHRTASRWVRHGEEGMLDMDTLPVNGMAHTAPYKGMGVTDSAAAGTALATGVKTYNGYISMDPQGVTVTTILEIAKMRGYAVGLVSTTQLGHATPASFAAHVPDRKQYPNIVEQMVGSGVDVLLAGGEDDLLPRNVEGCFPGKGNRFDDKNIVDVAKSDEYIVMCGPEEFYSQSAIPGQRYLGLFGDDGMLRPHTPSLADMTAFAIEVLSEDAEGFFLMVEGGQIDWAAHDNDAQNVISDTLAFDDAVAVGVLYAESVADALVIVTADHETGGMSIEWDESESFDQDGPFMMPGERPFFISWSTGSHTGADVPVMAGGLCADQLDGTYENTHIFDTMLHALQGCP